VRDRLLEFGEGVVGVYDQNGQALIERHHAHRMQVKPRIRNFLGVTLDRGLPREVDAGEAAEAQPLVAEERQSRAGAVDRYRQQIGLLDLQFFDQILADGRQQVDSGNRQSALGDRLHPRLDQFRIGKRAEHVTVVASFAGIAALL
jgi:hypothetical protein